MSRISPDRKAFLEAMAKEWLRIQRPVDFLSKHHHEFDKRRGRSPYCKVCGQARHYRLHIGDSP